MAKCTGIRCPMQVGYKVDECNHKDCPYRTEPITNADRIRNMTDEELALWICGVYDIEEENGKFINGIIIPGYAPHDIEEWLQQPCGGGMTMAEYIDRDAIYTAFANACTDVLERASEIDYIAGYSYELVIEILDNIPTVNVAPIKHGQWEWFDEDIGTPITGHEREWGWRCSHCKHELPDDYDDPDYRPMLDYCPYCGAKMDGGANNG